MSAKRTARVSALWHDVFRGMPAFIGVKGFHSGRSGKSTGGIIGFLFFICLGACLCPPPACSQDDPEISLVRTIEVREYGGLQVSTDVYEVSKGDSLGRILYGRGVIQRGPIPGKIIDMVKAFNPSLTDPNIIRVGQKLVLPEGAVELADLPEAVGGESAEVSETAGSKVTSSDGEKPEVLSTAGGSKTITVKKGDTLFNLLRDEGFTRGTILNKLIKATVRMNPSLSNPDLIFEGQKIELPLSVEAAEAVPAVRPEKPTSAMTRLEKTRPPAPLIKPILPASITTPTEPADSKPTVSPSKVLEGKPPVRPEAAADTANTIPPSAAVKPSPTESAVISGSPAAIAALSSTSVKAAKKEQTPRVKAPELPPSESVSTRTAISLIFTRMGERVFTRGQHFLPLKTGGQITINNKTFPIIEMRSGRRIVLDLDRRLPEEMVKIIRSNWSNYTIFRPKPNETLPAMLGRLFELGQYYKLNDKDEPWIIQGRVTVKARADWIVQPTEEDFSRQRGAIVTVLSGAGRETSSALAGYLNGIGIEVIDFNPQGNQIGPDLDLEKPKSELKVKRISPVGVEEFVKVILNLAGQKFESNLSIPLVEDDTQASDFKLTVQAPIYFTRNGKNFVASVGALAPEMVELLTGHQFEVIILPRELAAFEAARRLLTTLGIKTRIGLTVKASSRPAPKNIEVIAPGLMFSIADRDILLSAVGIPESLAPLFARPNLEVIEYGPEPIAPSTGAGTGKTAPEKAVTQSP